MIQVLDADAADIQVNMHSGRRDEEGARRGYEKSGLCKLRGFVGSAQTDQEHLKPNQRLIAARIADAQTFIRMPRAHSSSARHTHARSPGVAFGQNERGLGSSSADLVAKLVEWGFILPEETPSEREIDLFQQLVAKTIRRFAAGDVIMEAGAPTRSLVFLISGVITGRKPRVAAAAAPHRPGASSMLGCAVEVKRHAQVDGDTIFVWKL